MWKRLINDIPKKHHAELMKVVWMMYEGSQNYRILFHIKINTYSELTMIRGPFVFPQFLRLFSWSNWGKTIFGESRAVPSTAKERRKHNQTLKAEFKPRGCPNLCKVFVYSKNIKQCLVSSIRQQVGVRHTSWKDILQNRVSEQNLVMLRQVVRST